MKCLGKAWVHFYFAGADGLAGRSTKGLQEIGCGISIGNLHGFGSFWQAFKLVFGVGSLGDDIEKDLGTESTHGGVGEIPCVADISWIGVRR